MAITVFELEFDMFDTVMWREKTVNITGLSKIDVMRVFLTETKHMRIWTQHMSHRQAIKLEWDSIKHNIIKSSLSFPIVTYK